MRLGASRKSVKAANAEAQDAFNRADGNPRGSGDAARKKYDRAWKMSDRRIHGGMAGATAGAVGGMILQDGNRPGKRRK